MVSGIIIVKKPRGVPLQDITPSFKPFDNLHLELLENKKKLKKGLPRIYIAPKRRKESVKENFVPQTKEVKKIHKQKEHIPKKKPKEVKSIVDIPVEDEDFLAELGGDNDVIEHDDDKDIIDEEIDEEYIDEEIDEDIDEKEEDPLDNMSPEDRERYDKEEMIWRFRILKKQYKSPSITINEYNEHSDLGMMKQDYERTVRMLTLDDNVESYRTYLMGSFIVMEFVCTQWAGIDLQGFTKTQTMMMHKYERLLIELGEKSQDTWSSNLPVEIRLIGLVLMQAGIFYLGKIVSDRIGGSVADLFSGMMGQPPSNTNEEPTVKPKKKMKGPSMKPADFYTTRDGNFNKAA